jgi:hypothetical protein
MTDCPATTNEWNRSDHLPHDPEMVPPHPRLLSQAPTRKPRVKLHKTPRTVTVKLTVDSFSAGHARAIVANAVSRLPGVKVEWPDAD